MQHDRTRAAVSRQLKGMGASLYEVGIRHAERGMLNGVVSPNRRKFRQPNSSPATIASRSMTWPSP